MSKERIYIVVHYWPNQDGKFQHEDPDYCPIHDVDNKQCKIGHDHYRIRTTGPAFPLAVSRCSTHKRGFTLYPPGFVPHGRAPMAPVAPDGSSIKDDEHRFSGTYFQAALDAGKKTAWPIEGYEGNQQPRFRTQNRHLDRATLLLGIKPNFDEHLREETAEILSVSNQLLRDCESIIKEEPGYKAMGTAIYNVLNEIPDSNTIFERIAEAGAVAGLWPSPYYWDCRQNILKPSQFRQIRTRASP